MVKRYCDRCGAPTDGGNTHIVDKKTKTEVWVNVKHKNFMLSGEADLCPDCVNSFIVWWVTREGDKG